MMIVMPYNLILFDHFFEGFPISLLEAMCSGLPVIVTKVGAIPYFFKNGEDCILINPNSSSELVDAIRLLYYDDALRNSINLNARRKVITTFSWETISKCVHQIYQRRLNEI